MCEIERCRACGSTNVEQFLDLGDQPFANALIDSIEDFDREKKYPLSLSFCKDCTLVQLDYTADSKELFGNYFWLTSTSKTAKDYSHLFCENALKRQNSDGYILEIASNDGTFLKPFQNKHKRVLGVEPAKNVAEIAFSEGISTINDFFDESLGKKIVNDNGYPAVVFARNVLPHVEHLQSFVSGLNECLNSDGLLILEVHYAGKIYDELHYDSIYHEHLCYFTLESLEALLEKHNLFVFDIGTSPISGGSIVVYIRNHKSEATECLRNFRTQEKAAGYNELASWREFAKKTFEHKELLNALIKKETNKKICAYGASARSSTMINFCQINDIMFFVDQNRLKAHKYTPGSHVIILNPDELLAYNPEVILLMAWNFEDEIMELLRNKYNFKGKVIIPLPFPPIVEEI